jgi:hypothetical protein
MSSNNQISKDAFSEQCIRFETTLQTVLIRNEGLLELDLFFNVPAELKQQVESSLAGVLGSGQISERERLVLDQLCREKILEFEASYGAIVNAKEGEGSFKGLMDLERTTLGQFILHLMFESIGRRLNGRRREDFEVLFDHEMSD